MNEKLRYTYSCVPNTHLPLRDSCANETTYSVNATFISRLGRNKPLGSASQVSEPIFEGLVFFLEITLPPGDGRVPFPSPFPAISMGCGAIPELDL